VGSFKEKQLRVTLVLDDTNLVFPGTNSNTLILTGLRMSARVQAVARLATQCELKIYGMRLEDMAALTVVWANPTAILRHTVILEANSTGRGDGWVQVFKGNFKEAQPDFNGQPDVFFLILSVTALFHKINPVPPTSFPEQSDIGAIAQTIVEKMGDPWTLTIADGANDVVLSNQYLCGTLWDQLAQACQAAHCDFYVQGDEVLITPNNLPRSSIATVVLSHDTGLVGYPMFEAAGLNVTALFDPAFQCGAALEIKDVIPANAIGRWYPFAMSHELESLVPGGRWFTNLRCLKVLVS
jgi:hypothetical protein